MGCCDSKAAQDVVLNQDDKTKPRELKENIVEEKEENEVKERIEQVTKINEEQEIAAQKKLEEKQREDEDRKRFEAEEKTRTEADELRQIDEAEKISKLISDEEENKKNAFEKEQNKNYEPNFCETSESESETFQPQPVSEESFTTIQPAPGFVIKTKRDDASKVFINIFYHERLLSMISTAAKTSLDKNNKECLAYDVIIPFLSYHDCIDDETVRDKLCIEAIELVNSLYFDTLGLSYVVPKMRRGFVGDSIENVEVPSSLIIRDSERRRTVIKEVDNQAEEQGDKW